MPGLSTLTYLPATDRTAYVDGKDPFIWETLEHADRWAQDTGGEPSSSDPWGWFGHQWSRWVMRRLHPELDNGQSVRLN
jgi:hypothetical protein